MAASYLFPPMLCQAVYNSMQATTMPEIQHAVGTLHQFVVSLPVEVYITSSLVHHYSVESHVCTHVNLHLHLAAAASPTQPVPRAQQSQFPRANKLQLICMELHVNPSSLACQSTARQ